MPAAVNFCDTCAAPIFWAIGSTTGTRMPIDADPRPDGNVALNADPLSQSARATLTATVLGPLEAHGARLSGETLYVSHFATCPDAERWRSQARPRRRKLKDHA